MHILHDIARVWDVCWWWLLHVTGADNPSGVEYGWQSGIQGNMTQIALLGAAAHFFHQYNCHQEGCWRLGLHPYDHDGIVRKVCKKHHPHIRPLAAGELDAHAAGQP